LKILEEKLKKYEEDKENYTHNMPSYPLTLNGTFIMKREGASYYGFPEPKYIPHFKEILSRFDIFHDCTLLKQVYFTKRTQSKAI